MKKIATALLSCALSAATLAGCAANAAQVPQESQEPHTAALTATAAASVKSPKYVFLFIGDGMSYPQIQSTSDYLGALKDADYWQAQPSLDDNQGAILDGPEYLNFMNFEAAGSAVTYDSNSFAPDSASTATSIATGYKTYSGSINVDETGTVEYETISEKLHSQKGYSVGVITSVNLNHATPAAFYAHQASRSSYYEIGLELVESGFDYFAGGGLLKPTGSSGDQTDLYELAQEAGYTVAKTHAEADAIGTNTEKAIIIDEDLADSDAMAYELDRTDDMWSLADYVEKGIQVLVIPAASSLDAVAAVYDELGRALGGAHTGAAQAKAAWEAVSGRLSALEQTLAGVEKKTGLYVANADGSVATGDTVMHAVLTAAGLDNAAAQGAGWKLPDGAAAKAAVLLCPASMTGSVGAMAAFKASPAAKNKQIIGVDAIALERQTARMADAAQAIAEKLYPSAFAQTTGDTTAGTDTTAS